MKAIILAGGLGSRLSEETVSRPKPMVEIGGKPILWHIMKVYSSQGINEFVICLGYKGYVIKEYFANYFLHMSDVTFDLGNNGLVVHSQKAEPWKVTLVDTGDATQTGGRLLRAAPYIGSEDFHFTYGDGLSDVDLAALSATHKAAGRIATVTAVQPPGRFGALDIRDGAVASFREKPLGDEGWINGGFFILSPKVLPYISGDSCIWEREPLESLAAQGQLTAHKHAGFWHAMDTVRDKAVLESMWNQGTAPWKRWE